MEIIPKPVSRLFTDLPLLGDPEANWETQCIVAARFCAIISVGLGLGFSVVIVLGFGFEITVGKLLIAALFLVFWPIVMGTMLGTAMFLNGRKKEFFRTLFQRRQNKKTPNDTRQTDPH